MSDKKARKSAFVARLLKLVDTYKNVLIVGVDNVGSNQMQKTRIALRGKAEILMGKNTIIRTQLRKLIADGNTKLQALHDLMRGNVGVVFTNYDMKEVRRIIQENKRPAAARQGVPASNDVFVPPGPTGLDPGQTSFFQALNIATKIVKGTIEIINQVHLIKKGDKVSASHVALLGKLNILPFYHGFQVRIVYEDGFVYDADVLDISNDDLLKKFFAGVGKVAAISLAIGYPTVASLSHVVNNAFKKLVSIAVATDITFEQVAKLKDLLSNPEALAAAQAAQAAAVSAAPATAGGAAAKKEEPKKEEKPKEESGGDMGFSLFD
jgi:large subunit ribosomal protein LP0